MPPKRKEQITLDGPAASGKSTLAKLLAEKLDACYVNTGEMYRALTWKAIEHHIDPEHDHDNLVSLLDRTTMTLIKNKHNERLINLCLDGNPVDNASIRSPEVTAKVSFTAKIPVIREWIVSRQRNSESLGLIVVEGRDIGTVVFPAAKHKFYITASPEGRARRRLAQSGETLVGATLKSVVEEITERDRLDSQRKVSPLRPADDAVIIDTTELSIDEVVQQLVSIIHKNENHAADK